MSQGGKKPGRRRQRPIGQFSWSPDKPRERERKAMSVYLYGAEQEAIRSAAAGHGMPASDFMRYTLLCETDYGFADIVRRIEANVPGADRELADRAINLVGWHVINDRARSDGCEHRLRTALAGTAATQPAEFSIAPVAIAAEPASPPGLAAPLAAEIEPALATPLVTEPAIDPALPARASYGPQLWAMTLWTTRAVRDLLETFGKALIIVTGDILDLLGRLRRAGRRPYTTRQMSPGPTFGGCISAAAMAALIPANLPLEWGGGWLGYRLLNQNNEAALEATNRSPEFLQQRLTSGYFLFAVPGNLEKNERCKRRIKRVGHLVDCTLRVGKDV